MQPKKPPGNFLSRLYRDYAPNWLVPSQGMGAIIRLGHQAYVGDRWSDGDLQMKFLLRKGLQPNYKFLDIGCGSLRLGSILIPCLEQGCYFGVDRHAALINLGVRFELGQPYYLALTPKLLVSEHFEFEKFNQTFDIAFAGSLFNHLTKQDIGLCLRRLSPCMSPHGSLFASFTETPQQCVNWRRSHDRRIFRYTASELTHLAYRNGFHANYIGDWGHPDGEAMMRFWRANIDKAEAKASIQQRRQSGLPSVVDL